MMIDNTYQMSQDARMCFRFVALQIYILNGGIAVMMALFHLKGIQNTRVDYLQV